MMVSTRYRLRAGILYGIDPPSPPNAERARRWSLWALWAHPEHPKAAALTTISVLPPVVRR